MPMSEWQLIETAPTDGTIIVGRQGQFVCSVLWRDIYNAWVTPTDEGWQKVIAPTHWQPNPERLDA